jgi:GNAT superfamily N-acetyltransferase
MKKYQYYSKMTMDHKYLLNTDNDPHFTPKPVFRIVSKTNNGLLVGVADFAYHADAGSIVCWNVDIQPTHRRKGIATQLYNLAEAHFSDQISPFPGGHSKQAQAFWLNRNHRK